MTDHIPTLHPPKPIDPDVLARIKVDPMAVCELVDGGAATMLDELSELTGVDPAALLYALRWEGYDGLAAIVVAVAEDEPRWWPTWSPTAAIEPGPCSCECPGCDGNYGHCMKPARGCGWRR